MPAPRHRAVRRRTAQAVPMRLPPRPATRWPRAAASIALGLLLATTVGCRTTLSSELSGARRPATLRCELGERAELRNGDFTIVQNCTHLENRVVGDGIAEATTWSFDLSDEDVASCYPESAVLELELRPVTGDLLGETLRVPGRWAMGLEAIQSLEPGRRQKVAFDMMLRNGRPSPYTPSEIRALLLDDPPGRLPMVYELNAIVSSARLTIRCRS